MFINIGNNNRIKLVENYWKVRVKYSENKDGNVVEKGSFDIFRKLE